MTELDETKETQDVNTSEDTKGTSGQEPETFTKEDMEAVRTSNSNALADVGRLKKTVESNQRIAKEATGRLNQMVKDWEDAELKTAGGDTEQVNAIKERQLRRRTESKLAEVELELGEKADELKLANAEKVESTKERNAREIASRLGVNANLLAKLAKSTDGSTEAIEEIAKELPKKGETKSLKVDSGKTSGSKGELTIEQVKKMSPEEQASRSSDIAKMPLALGSQ